MTSIQQTLASAILKVSNSSILQKIAEILGIKITPTPTATFKVGYYIEPRATPISKIDFNQLKKNGITSVAIRASTNGSAGVKYTELPGIKKLLDAAGLEAWAWVWDGFPYAKQVAAMGWNILIDMETYQMSTKIAQLTQMRKDTQGRGFIICIKPQGWDGDQKVDQLVKICDFITFMSYTGDYKKSNTELANLYKTWNAKYPGKFIASLESYQSDANVVPKTNAALQAEIKAVQPYTKGVFVFRYGLSNLDLTPAPAPTPAPVNTVKLDEVLAAARVVAEYIQVNRKAPSNIIIAGKTVNPSTFTGILSNTLVNLSNSKKTDITIQTIANAPTPIPSLTGGQLIKTDYLDACKRLISWNTKNKKTPNYVTTPIGNLSPENLVDMLSRAVKFYSDTKALPNYINVGSVGQPGTPSTVPTDLKPYLTATLNCEVQDATIQARAKELKTAEKIFNFVRDKLKYLLYYNTRYGAVGTLKRNDANCCDHSHLLVALSRAAGIPARYVHGSCKFGDGKFYGHVWAELYVNGKWVRADAINDKNTLGTITNWDLNTATVYNRYKELPF